MKIRVKVVPKSSRVSVSEENGWLKVRLTAAPEKGKANKQLVDVLAEYYHVSKSRVRIVSGKTSQEKIVEIEK